MAAEERAKPRRRAFRLFGLACALALALLAAELGLRLTGRGPWRPDPPPPNNPPVMLQPDARLGWVNKPGEYRFDAYAAGLPPIQMTFWPGGLRATGPSPSQETRRILLLGGSCMQGMALSDSETLGWKLQEAYPKAALLNASVSGYGSYQSLLRLEEVLKSGPPPALVIYGFASFHAIRNVGHHSWLRNLRRREGRGQVATPFCTLGEQGQLLRHEPEGYSMWPLKGQLALVSAMRFKTKGRRDMRDAVTHLLLKEMQAACKAVGSSFLLLIIDRHPKRSPEYKAYCEQEGIPYLDASHPRFGDPELSVPGEGHPNGAHNSYWLEKLTPVLNEALQSKNSR